MFWTILGWMCEVTGALFWLGLVGITLHEQLIIRPRQRRIARKLHK